MKKTFINFVAGSILFCTATSSIAATDANLYPSNLTDNTYYDAYNDNTKIISGINFSSLSDGTNSTLSTNPFKIKLYLLVSGTTNPIFIKTIDVPSGQKHMTAVPYTNLSVDLKTIAGLAAGTYRLGVYIDSDENVTESNEKDNAVLFGDEIVYTAAAQPKADLQVASFTYSVNSTKTMLTNMSVKIDNIGAAASPDSQLELRIEDANDPELYVSMSIDISSLSANSSETMPILDLDISQEFDPQAVYKVYAIVDPENTISESNEGNNTKLVSNNMYQGPLSVAARSMKELNLAITTSNLIIFDLEKSENIELTIVDTKGNVVSTIVKEELASGSYKYEASSEIQNGQLYLCKLSTDNYTVIKKMIKSN